MFFQGSGVKMFTIDKLPDVSPMISRAHTISSNDLFLALESLRFRERSFLTFRLRGLTYRQIGNKFKVSRERARQIVRDATLKLLSPTKFMEMDNRLQFKSPHDTWRYGVWRWRRGVEG
jgi:DNA-directed RNA polymerase sigma subunit (sigma70/sigma32)